MNDLEGRVAIVTGAAGRIGRSIVETLAARGASVVASDVRAGAIEGGALTVPADLSDLEQVRAIVHKAVEAFGRLDIVVNNGAVLDNGGTIEQCDEDLFDRTMAVNVKAPFFLIKQAIPHMRAQGGGSIVNIASVLGMIARPAYSSYATSKGAVIQLTRSVAVDYAKENIRCNAICPGNVLAADEADDAESAALHPVNRSGRAKEIAEVVAFLAGDGASFMHGSIVTVDGGFTTW